MNYLNFDRLLQIQNGLATTESLFFSFYFKSCFFVFCCCFFVCLFVSFLFFFFCFFFVVVVVVVVFHWHWAVIIEDICHVLAHPSRKYQHIQGFGKG